MRNIGPERIELERLQQIELAFERLQKINSALVDKCNAYVIENARLAALAQPAVGDPVALREVGLNRDVSGMCIVTINGREAIRDNGDVISHYATLDWFAQPPAPMTLTQDQIMEYVREAGLDWHRGWIMGEPPVNRYEEFARAVLKAQKEKQA